jgi:hypothetical protein
MYSGMMIEELMEMVARAEDQARGGYVSETERDAARFVPRLVYELADAQPMMAGVA